MLNFEEKQKIINNKTYKMNFPKSEFITPSSKKINVKDKSIDVIFNQAIEEDDRGNICHNITLVHDKKCAGYLYVYYLPKVNKEEYFPDLA